MLEMYLSDPLYLNAKSDISGKLWRVCLSNGKCFDVWKEPEYNGRIWAWCVETQYFDKEEYALQYLKTLVAEKLTGKRILFHRKYEVPAICGVNGAACRARGECNRALCDRCPVAEQFFADRDGVELIYAVERG